MYLLELINLQLTVQILVFFVAVIFFVALIRWLSTGFSPTKRRLHEMNYHAHKTGETYSEGSFNVHWIEPVAGLIQPQEDWRRSHLKTRLVTAGYRSPNAQTVFLASKVILAFVLSLLVIFPLIMLGFFTAEKEQAVFLTAFAAVSGFFLPNIYLFHKKQKRQQIMSESFPDALDLLVVCVEAGLSMDGAIQRVSRELMVSHPELGEELALVSLELRAGKSRDEALRGLADRTGLEDVRSLTSILIQADHFGTSVAAALREHATEMRLIRIQRAKERAAKLPVKMIFPIMVFIFPAMFLVILGPSIIRIIEGLM